MFARTLALLLASTALAACATSADPQSTGDSTAAQIQTQQQMTAYLETKTSSPLDHLSATAKQHFVSSLVFTSQGLASYDYTDLDQLPAAQSEDILQLFGHSNSERPNFCVNMFYCNIVIGECQEKAFSTCCTTCVAD